MKIDAFGDRALLVSFGHAINRKNNQQVKALYHNLKEEKHPGILSIVPSYNSLCVLFDPKYVNHVKVRELVLQKKSLVPNSTQQGKLIRIPVCYGGEKGPDLEQLAHYHGISPGKLIDLHCGQNFFVYTMGFLPGFAYMGDFPSSLPTPRKTTPRTRVPEGSVGLAGFQTGIYPRQSSGGWQIIGQTPIPLVLPDHKNPFLIAPEDQINFFQISLEEFDSWKERSQSQDFNWAEIYG